METPNCCPIRITALPMGMAGGVCFPVSIGCPCPMGPPFLPIHPLTHVCSSSRLLFLLPCELQQLRQGLRVQGAVQQQVQLLPLSYSPLPVNSRHTSGMGGGGHKNYFFHVFCFLYWW